MQSVFICLLQGDFWPNDNPTRLAAAFAMLMFCVLGAILIRYHGRLRAKLTASYGWPSAPGTITNTSKIDDRGDEGCNVRIAYEYVVNAARYTSDRVTFLATRGIGERTARELVRTYPVGRNLPVFYNPSLPSEAVLVRQVPYLNAYLYLGIGLVVVSLISFLRLLLLIAFEV